MLCSAWGACALALWAAAVVVWDARTLRLPNALVLPAVPAVWGAAVVCGHAEAILGGILWWAAIALP
ncbi:prepilin peptidase, partial [Corynebacterium heidelbergense]